MTTVEFNHQLTDAERLAQSLERKQALIEAYLTEPRIPFGKFTGQTYTAIARIERKYALWFVRSVKDNDKAVDCMLAALTLENEKRK